MALHPTREFAREFEAETGRLLRHRFWWFLASVGVLYVVFRSLWMIVFGVFATSRAVGGGFGALADNAMTAVRFGSIGAAIVGLLTILDIAAIAGAGVWAARRRLEPAEQFGLTQGLIVLLGLTHIAAMILLGSLGFPWVAMLLHIAACVFLPWTPRQALRPIAVIIAVNAVAVLLLGDGSWTARGIFVGLSLFAAVPGLLVSLVRHSRRAETFGVRMMQARYGQMKRELFDARRIHEALFPRPIQSGPLRFEYRYQPMLQIGGDYLYARFSPPIAGGLPAFNILLMDVTGHGIAAALTVNRLYGEVERLFAEDPHAGPGDVLLALNRYVHLTLANHSIYVTALCIRVDQERDTLEYASGGHPPAFLCDGAGNLHQLDSTSFVLGAAAGSDFDPAVRTHPFGPGDTLIAYTDGALECRNQLGRMLGVAGLSRLVGAARAQRAPSSSACFADTVIRAVETHRHGKPEDDTLVVEITRTAESHPSENGVDRVRQTSPMTV
ncbi:MAG TPA: PP2C family protein-serine/threonine phosphatase [Phycisphaerales bacterium]|nr:PP2C family protein-serine/threonine phosphatase [Phycisphaerales bacterium]